MKAALYFLLFVTGGFAAFWSYVYVHQVRPATDHTTTSPVPETTPTPTPTAFSVENAPSYSLRGTITEMNDGIWWVSRTATEASQLTSRIMVQQGDTLIASDSGNITVAFGDAAELKMEEDSAVDIVQTLPVDLVFGQRRGVAEDMSKTSPVSVRSLRLLITQTDGVMRVQVDEDTHFITVEVESGDARAAYNDVDFVSQIVRIGERERFVFDSDGREGQID